MNDQSINHTMKGVYQTGVNSILQG